MDLEAARKYHQKRDAERRRQREAVREEWLRRVRSAILQAASANPGVQRVLVFGSLLKPGRFRVDSDVDVAVACDSLEIESAFWRDLEQALGRDVDLHALSGGVEESAVREGELVYGRQDADPGDEHSA